MSPTGAVLPSWKKYGILLGASARSPFSKFFRKCCCLLGAPARAERGSAEPVLSGVYWMASPRPEFGSVLRSSKLRLHPILKRPFMVRGAFGLVKARRSFGRQSALPSELVVVVDFAQGFEDETALLGKVGDDIHVAAARMRKANWPGWCANGR